MKRCYKRICSLLLLLAVFALPFLSGCSTDESGSPKYNEAHPGEITYYETKKENIVSSDETGLTYANNEILLTASENASYSDIERLAAEYDAEIKGYIEVVGDYQLVLSKKYTEDELNDIVDELKENELVDEASLDIINMVSSDSKKEVTNDTRWKDKWDEEYPDGENWGLEAIRCPSAWTLYNSMKPNPVKVGVVDGSFFTDHEDLKNVFAETFYNNIGTSDDNGHGTHVAGTIGAEYNNSKGITGVYPSSRGNLYGAATSVSSNINLPNDNDYVPTFTYKCCFSELIVRNVKVINFSQHTFSYEAIYAATQNDDSALKSIRKQADIFSSFLKRFIDKNYDFLIVASAGNCSGKKYEKNSSAPSENFGYEEKGDGDDNCLAEFNSIVNCISDEKVKEHIIVVGAARCNLKIEGIFDWGKEYERASFSNIGNRVDVMAPGYSITSTGFNSKNESEYVGGEKWSGTSMAAPHVSGVAAMVWSINNKFTAKEVKKILTDTANIDVNDSSQKMINADLAVIEACTLSGHSENKINDYGMISICTYNSLNNTAMDNVEVTVYEIGTDTEIEKSKTDENGCYVFSMPEGNYYIKAEKEGYSTVKSEDLKVEKCKIIYSSIPLNEAVTDFSIPENLILTIGQTDLITPKVEPENAKGYTIKWTSSDESVATVNPTGEQGIVASHAKGTATITAELESGGKTITKSTEVRVASKGRDTVLVLDVSGSMSGTPMNEMKKSAVKFCEDLLTDEYNNRVGVVCFDNGINTYDLTNDITGLTSYINGLSTGGSTNMEEALVNAENLLDNSGNPEHIKNIVIMADGLPNRGKKSTSGSSGIQSSSGFNTSSEYANAVVDTAQLIMQKYNMYSLGFFHSLSSSDYDNCKLLMSKLTNMPEGYHEVQKAEDLQFEFGDIATNITDGSKIVINIACPVDVTVSYGGETLSSSSESFNDEASFGTLQLLGDDKDIKVLSLDSDKQYDVNLNGTGEGTMDYSVNYVNADDEITDYRNFSSVPITKTTVINSSTENSTTVNLNIDNDGDGKVDVVWEAGNKGEGRITVDNTETTAPETTEAPSTVEVTEPVKETENDDGGTMLIIIISVCSLLALGLIVLIVVLVNVKNKEKYDSAEIPIVQSERAVTEDRKVEDEKQEKEAEKSDAAIEILTGSMAGMKIPLSDGEILTLGKNPSVCQVVFTSDYTGVSRLHCTVSYSSSSKKFFVTDCSSNGTYFVSKRRLEKGKRTPVNSGEIIYLCDEKCTIRLLSE
ncbi:MAG: S8 family serine peptidase [Ruminococcus sp.]